MPNKYGQLARSVKLVDELVGENIRKRRSFLGMTQEILAEALNISYQQVQKYESGTNRISSSRLFDIARILNSDIGGLFEGLETPASSTGKDEKPGRLTIEVAQNFSAIQNTEVKAAIAKLIRSLGTSQ